MISVLMPTYNQAQFLSRALAAFDSQTYRDVELIVCDDASTDETPKMLGRTRLVRHEFNQGTAAAINSAFKLSQGEFVTWVSSDNVMYPNWLEVLHQEIRNFGAVYSGYNRVEGRLKIPVRQGPYRPDQLIETENSYFGPSFLIRRECWAEHKGQTAHDYQNWTRVEEICWLRGLTLGYVDELLCDYHTGAWQTVRKFPERYDAGKWRDEAIRRRQSIGYHPGGAGPSVMQRAMLSQHI